MKQQQKTFAQRAKEIEKKFEGRNDKISLRTKKALMQQLREEQEKVKASLDEPKSTGEVLMDELKMLGNTAIGTVNPGSPLGYITSQLAWDGLTENTEGTFGKLSKAAHDEQVRRIQAKKNAENSSMNKYSGLEGTSLMTNQAFLGALFGKIGASGATGAAAGADAAAEGMAGAGFDKALGYGTDIAQGIQGMFGKSKVDDSGATRPDLNAIESANTMGAVKGGLDTAKSFATGDIVGGVTGAIKTIGGIFGGNKDMKKAEEALANNDQALANKVRPNDYMAALGGILPNRINKYSGLDGTSLIDKQKFSNIFNKVDSPDFKNINRNDYPDFKNVGVGDISIKTPDFSNAFQKSGTTSQTPITDKFMKRTDKMISKIGQPTFGDKLKQGTKWLGENVGNIAQYAPAIGALTNKIERVETPRGTRIQGEPVLGRQDERRLMKEIRGSNNIAGSAKEGSGGNLTAYNALALKGKLDEARAVGKGMQTMADSNLNQELRETQMGEARKFANMQADERFLEREEANEGAYQTAKQENRAAIFENIGNIGREETDKKTIKDMYGYKWNGKYWTDPKGKRVSEVEYQNALNQIQNMFGGYLKR